MKNQLGGAPTGVGLAKTAVLPPMKESFNQIEHSLPASCHQKRITKNEY